MYHRKSNPVAHKKDHPQFPSGKGWSTYEYQYSTPYKQDRGQSPHHLRGTENVFDKIQPWPTIKTFNKIEKNVILKKKKKSMKNPPLTL